ncbi:MAG: hypothetical protein ACREUT_15500 [Steroidobacteraceae bacterium]
MSAQPTFRDIQGAHARSELGLDVHRILRCVRRRNHWMKQARTYGANGQHFLAPQCIACARTANRDAIRWIGELRKDLERVL